MMLFHQIQRGAFGDEAGRVVHRNAHERHAARMHDLLLRGNLIHCPGEQIHPHRLGEGLCGHLEHARNGVEGIRRCHVLGRDRRLAAPDGKGASRQPPASNRQRSATSPNNLAALQSESAGMKVQELKRAEEIVVSHRATIEEK